MAQQAARRYRVTLACDSIPAGLGQQVAPDIAAESTQRPWRENVECDWRDGSLLLSAENDFDPQGLALMDEFSDAISATTPVGFGYAIRLVSALAI